MKDNLPSPIVLAFFAKTPGFTKVKTRLAKDIGEENALAFYMKCLEVIRFYLEEIKKHKKDFEFYWAIAEDSDKARSYWQEPVLSQKGNGLGERLDSIYQELRSEGKTICFMGTDSPMLQLGHLLEILNQAQNQKQSMGKAKDGGFYFFSSKANVKRESWLNVNYSSPNTYLEMLNEFSSYGPMTELPLHYDVDTLEDLKYIKNLKIDKKGLAKPQLEILHWIEKII